MGSRFLKDAGAFIVACLLGATIGAYHHRAHFDPHIVWDGFTLPGFDAHVYVAMAEEPRVFTVAPWGYRILLPELLGTFLPPRLIVPGFEWAARVSLLVASGLLLVYLRLGGATVRAALLAVAAVILTPSVEVVFDNPFLVEPFALALLLAVLIAIEGGASGWVIALGLLLLSLAKEIWVLLLPLVFLKDLSKGVRTASLHTMAAAAPALWVGVMIRWIWSPQGGLEPGGLSFLAAILSTTSNVPVFAPEFVLGGLMILAVAALYRVEAREYLRLHALTLLPLLALPLFAASYTGAGPATSFFAGDVRRLLIYALPFAAALAVHLDPAHGAPRALPSAPRLTQAAMALVLASLIAPAALDGYSRADLTTSRDGPYVLGFARETLKTARKLDRGETVILDPLERTFAWGVSPPRDLAKLRFFLRSGFGPLAHYGIHDIKMRETKAIMIAPLLSSRALTVSLTMDARESAWISLFAGGRQAGEALIGPQAVQMTFDLAPSSLFRGDNPIELRCVKAATALPRILRLQFSQAQATP